jgi:hypothetical protein
MLPSAPKQHQLRLGSEPIDLGWKFELLNTKTGDLVIAVTIPVQPCPFTGGVNVGLVVSDRQGSSELGFAHPCWMITYSRGI